jgi:hypothetical protein
MILVSKGPQAPYANTSWYRRPDVTVVQPCIGDSTQPHPEVSWELAELETLTVLFCERDLPTSCSPGTSCHGPRRAGENFSFCELFGSPGPIGGKRLRKSVGVTSDTPDYSDHCLQIIVSVGVAVTRIPTEIDGVHIVSVHEHHPGFCAILTLFALHS